MKKAIIFDMDGVLFDTEMIYINKRINFFKEFDPSISEELIRKNAGGNGTKFIKMVYKDLPEDEVNEIISKYRTIREPSEDFQRVMFDGVPETLKYLYEDGCILALASSSRIDKIERALKAVHIDSYFTQYLSAETFKAIKPDPTVYLESVKRLNLKKEEVLVVEDSTFGIEAAHRAGLEVICKRDDRFGYDQSGCEYYIDEIPEIIDIWKSLINN